jgi:hypothetical protein
MICDDDHDAGGLQEMNADRAAAYARVMTTLRELGPSKLLAGEQETIRAAADSLLFSEALPGDEDARQALERVKELCRALVESERWTQPRAERLAQDVAACGPAPVPALRAA